MPCISDNNYKERTTRLKGANRLNEDLVLVTDYLAYKCESALKDSKNQDIKYTWKNVLDGFFSEILQGEYAEFLRFNHAKLLQNMGVPVIAYTPYTIEKKMENEIVDKVLFASAISKFHSNVDKGIIIKSLREFPAQQKENKARKTKKPLKEMSNYEILRDSLDTSLNRLVARAKQNHEPNEPVLAVNYKFITLLEQEIKAKDRNKGGVKITRTTENKEG